MTGMEYLWGYCQLRIYGYSHSEATEILEKIKLELNKTHSTTEEVR